MNDKIFIVQHKNEEKFLHKKTEDFDFTKFSKKEVNALIEKMKKIMQSANGVGLAANQIGLNFKLFVAAVPQKDGDNKFYAIFNPRIQGASGEKLFAGEGCLSVPGLFGDVERSANITLKGSDKNGRPLKIKAWGLLAEIFQHEVDHLNGILFVDKAKNLRTLSSTEEK